MGVLAWIVLGGVAGWLASLIAGLGKQMGCLTNIAAGIVGALVGGLIFNHLGSRGITGFNWWSLLVAFVGALIVLLFVRLLASLVKK
jgi:uncharacterized membrane protein YeaQ/YmgE (transglycosylase-associated protein family)